LAADRDLVAVRELLFALDPTAVHTHAVAAPEVGDHYGLRGHGQSGMVPRHERVIQRQLAIRRATNHELAFGQLDVVMVVAQRVPHAPAGSESPSASMRSKLSRSSWRGPPRELTLSTTRRAAGASEVRSEGGKVIKL
jgi:hypothetical protein